MKEIFIYRQLEQIEFKHFFYPKLKHTDGKTLIVTEFVSDSGSLPVDRKFYDSAIKAILELNTCDFPFYQIGGPGWVWERINRWKFSRSTKTLRHLFESFFIARSMSFQVFVKILFFWARSFGSSSRLKKPLLVHRDIFHANILRPDSKRTFFIDFEKMGMEKRWVFADALKVILAGQSLSSKKQGGAADGFEFFAHLDPALLKTYWDELLLKRPEIDPDPDNFNLQLKFCILGWILSKLAKGKVSPATKRELTLFIEKIILGPDSQLEKWLNESPVIDSLE